MTHEQANCITERSVVKCTKEQNRQAVVEFCARGSSSEKVIRRIMHEEDLHVIAVKRKKYNSYIGEISPAVDNLIQKDFHADKPNKKWLTDITEFHIPAGKVYLSPILDCFDGLAVSWSIGTSPNADLVNSMLDNAVSLLDEIEHPIVHSDRGGHRRWTCWIQRMEDANLIRFMSKKDILRTIQLVKVSLVD